MIMGQTTEKEYRAKKIDSSSSLKEFSMNRRKYYKRYYLGEKIEEEEDSKASVIGRITETLLFEPKEFDNRFYMSAIPKAPTGLLLEFVEALYRHTKNNTDENGNITKDFYELLEAAYKDSGFKIKFEAVLSKFNGTDAEIYYKEIREVRSRGLTVITIDDITNAEKTVEELKTNEFTAKIINLVDSDRYKVFKQYQIDNFEIDGLPLKGMIDYLIIDHKEKTISPYDLKITYSVEGFYQDYYLYRRSYIQAYLYKEACKQLRKDLNFIYYTVENLQFIVADSINYFSPLIYTLSNKDMDDAYVGFENKGREYPGVKNIIKDLIWAKEENTWRVSRINYLNNGVVPIKE